MEFTYEEFKLCVRSAIMTHKASFDLDVSELSPKNIAQIMLWCDEKNYGYELKGDVMTVEVLKGFGK